MPSTAPRFRVETEVTDQVALVSFFGDLGLRVAAYCEARLADVEWRVGHVVVDLRGLTSIDRTGVHTLVRAQMRSRQDDWKLTLVRGKPSVDEAFTPPVIAELFHWVKRADTVFPHRSVRGATSRAHDERSKGRRDVTGDSQPLQALRRANRLRIARSQLRHRVADGQVTAGAVVLESPPETATMSLFDLLRCQPMWGTRRTHRFLIGCEISETKTIGSLTDRQRTAIAARLFTSD
jgi:anti-anti-sigma factor